MARDSSPDRAYLIRCWQERAGASGDDPRWRFSVEEVLHERRRRGFRDLASLIAYLREEIAAGTDEGASKGPN